MNAKHPDVMGQKPHAGKPAAKRTLFTFLGWCFALALCAESLILARQNRDLKALRSPDSSVPAGRILRNLSGVDLDGRYHKIVPPASSSERLLIFTFSPGCAPCEAGMPEAQRVASTVRSEGWTVLWVSGAFLGDTVRFTQEHPLPHGTALLTEVPARV